MEYKRLDLVRLFSGSMSALSVLGLAALTLWPGSTAPDPTARTILTVSGIAFWMIYTVTASVGTVLLTQADQIAALQRQLEESRSER